MFTTKEFIKLKKLSLFTTYIFIMLMSGCANNQYKADNNVTLSNTDNDGIVVVTINTSGAPKGFHYIITSENNEISLTIPNYGITESLLPMLQSDFKDIKGKLVVLKLPVGKYKFTEWYNITGGQYGSYELRSKQDFPLYFTVEPNKATYIGEIIQTNKYSGFSLVESKLSISNSIERDKKLLISKYPNINDNDLLVKLAYKSNTNITSK